MDTIYLIEDYHSEYGEVFKIGFTTNLEKRMKSFKTGNINMKLLETFETKHNRKLEGILHRIYSHCRKDGEWFCLKEDDILAFKSICKKFEDNLDLIEKNSNNFY